MDFRRKWIAVVTVATFTPLAFADEAAAEHTFTGNITFASEYLYRGIAQTRGKPALQGGFDYAHRSGLYAGVWGSNISWINDSVAGASASLEIDVYGGYKGAITDEFGFDVGVLTYNYPGSGKPSGNAKPDTVELYGALSWRWLTLKYSRTTGSLFGWTQPDGGKTSGSGYLELNATYDLGDGWGITGHIGHQNVKGLSDASYSDFKVGVTKDVGFGVVGLAYSTTTARDRCAGSGPAGPRDLYCFVKHDGSSAYEAGKNRVLLTFSRSF
ncbi:hypothetical protein JCM16106_05820 [Hydrogenophilus islandicus]